MDTNTLIKIYVDDLCCFSETIGRHLLIIEYILQILLKHGLTAKLNKLHFGLTEINFLGHIITGNNIIIDPKKNDAILNYPPREVSDKYNDGLEFV